MSQRELVQIPMQTIRGTQLADGGWKYLVYTPELLPEQVAGMAEISNKPGWFVCKPNEQLIETDIPKDDAPVESDQRTPSQRLRGVVYRVWETQTNQTEDFNTQYWPRICEQLITKYKEKLNP